MASDGVEGLGPGLLCLKYTTAHSFAFLTSQGYFKSNVLNHKTGMSVKWHEESPLGYNLDISNLFSVVDNIGSWVICSGGFLRLCALSCRIIDTF